MNNKVNFDFLSSIELTEVKDGKGEQLGKIQKNPEGGSKLRLFADGKVYPSQELVNSFQLNYTDSDFEDKGFGLDIFLSGDWAQWPIDQPKDILFITAVDRREAKIDLFTGCKHDENGKPKSDVMTQGSATFGKAAFVDLLKKYLGEEDIFENRIYIDLEVVTDSPVKMSTNNIYHLPAVVARGKNKGDVTYKRRENLVIYPLVLVGEDDLLTTDDTNYDVENQAETADPDFGESSQIEAVVTVGDEENVLTDSEGIFSN